jgi:hypothetical protein
MWFVNCIRPHVIVACVLMCLHLWVCSWTGFLGTQHPLRKATGGSFCRVVKLKCSQHRGLECAVTMWNFTCLSYNLMCFSKSVSIILIWLETCGAISLIENYFRHSQWFPSSALRYGTRSTFCKLARKIYIKDWCRSADSRYLVLPALYRSILCKRLLSVLCRLWPVNCCIVCTCTKPQRQ